MEQRIQLGASDHALVFYLVSSVDHVAGLTGATPTVTISKNGGAFAAPAGAVSELGNGWYQTAADSADVNMLGPLILHAEASGADPCDVLAFVVPGYGASPYYQGVPGTVLPWLMLLSSDHVTGATGVNPSALIAAPGASFAAPAGTVQDIGHGWYGLNPTAADLATAGPLKLHATASGADPADAEFDIAPAGVASGSSTGGGSPAPTSALSALMVSIKAIIQGTGLFTANNVFTTEDLNDPEIFVQTRAAFAAVSFGENRLKDDQYHGAGTHLAGQDGEILVRVAKSFARDRAGRDDAALLTAGIGLVDLAAAVAGAIDGEFPTDPDGNLLTQVEIRVQSMARPGSYRTAGETYRTWRYMDLRIPIQWTLAASTKS